MRQIIAGRQRAYRRAEQGLDCRHHSVVVAAGNAAVGTENEELVVDLLVPAGLVLDDTLPVVASRGCRDGGSNQSPTTQSLR